MISKDSHILLTGATGFLGSYVLRFLISSGYRRIICIKRDSSDLSLIQDVQEDVEWINCDITDSISLEEVVSQVQVIIHVAAYVSLSNKNRNKVMQVNTQATASLVDLSLYHNIKKFVFVSSVSAFGMSEQNGLIDEKTEWKDSPVNNVYSISKQLAEREIQRGIAEGLHGVIINPSMIIGAGIWDSSTVAIFKMVYKGLPFYPSGSVGVVDVRDVAKMILILLERDDVCGENFIASSENWTHKKMITQLSGLFDKKSPTKEMSPTIVRLGSWFASVSSLFIGENSVLNAESIKVSQYSFLFDNSKSIDKLGFQYIPVIKSLQDTAKVFLDTFPKSKAFGRLDIE